MTNVEIVSLLIGDTSNALFSTTEIQAFLDLESDNVYMAASLACHSLATEAARLAKAEKIGNYSIDRKAMSTNYVALAKKYEEMSEDAPAFAIAEQSVSDFALREIVRNAALRG